MPCSADYFPILSFQLRGELCVGPSSVSFGGSHQAHVSFPVGRYNGIKKKKKTYSKADLVHLVPLTEQFMVWK